MRFQRRGDARPGRRGLGDQPCGGGVGHPQASVPTSPHGREATNPALESAVLKPDSMKSAVSETRVLATENDKPWRGERRIKGHLDDVQKPRQRRGRIVVALSLAAVVALLGVLARPSPPSLSTTVTGDVALAAHRNRLAEIRLDRQEVVRILAADAVAIGIA